MHSTRRTVLAAAGVAGGVAAGRLIFRSQPAVARHASVEGGGERATLGHPGVVRPEGAFSAGSLPTGASDWINVKNFQAAGDGVTDDTTAIQQALTASSKSGGLVYFPAGTYLVNQPLTYYANTQWLGASIGATVILLGRELWQSGPAPARFIVPDGLSDSSAGSFAHGQEWTVSHMTIAGNGAGAIGKANSRTNGIALGSACVISHCMIQGFFAGIEILSDHQRVEYTRSSGNYVNVQFSDAQRYGRGNQTFYACMFDGSGLASIHMTGTGTWDGGTAMQVHLGYGPVGILKTDSQSRWDGNGNPVFDGTPSTAGAVTGCELTGLYLENIGNCGFLDISTGNNGSLMVTNWRSPGFSWNYSEPRTLSTFAPLDDPRYQGAWAFDLRYSEGSLIDLGENQSLPGTTGMVNLRDAGALTIRAASPPPASTLGSGVAWTNGSVEWIAGYTNICSYLFHSAARINVGDLVEIVPATFSIVRRATGLNPLLGVAASPGVAGGAIFVQLDGVATVNCDGVGQILGGEPLSCSTRRPYLAAVSRDNPGARRVGFGVGSGDIPTRSLAQVVLRFE